MLVVAAAALYAALAGGTSTGADGSTSTATLGVRVEGLRSSGGLEAPAARPALLQPSAVDRARGLNRAGGGSSGESASAQAPADTPTPAPTPTATSGPSRRSLCEDAAGHPLYCVYTVQSGDTLSSIAGEFEIESSGDLAPAELLAQSNRPDVVHSDEIVPGQKLRIPAQSGIIHTVVSAESLAHVAAMYGVKPESIQAVPGNRIENADLLAAGVEILVPGPEKVPQPAAASAPDDEPPPTPVEETATLEPDESEAPADAAAEAAPTETPLPTATPVPATPTSTPRTRTSPTATPTATAPAAKTRFVWPADGPISSYFGPSHPLGIDIDSYANPNQPVKAAAAGTVTFAGGNPCCSYGYYVIVQHDGGFTTLYAHLSAIAVTAGQKVAQGRVLGNVGHTGYATGNHLHFEVHLNGAVVDPVRYLPPR